MLQRALDRLRAMTSSGNARIERRREGFERRIDRRRNDLTQLQAEGLGWRGGVVLGWAGMRGVVTLAAAQSLPRSTPYYEQLVLIAFTVAITTLLVQGGTLPFVIRLTGIRGSDRVADRRELAALLEEMSTAGVAVLDGAEVSVEGVPVDPEVDQPGARGHPAGRPVGLGARGARRPGGRPRSTRRTSSTARCAARCSRRSATCCSRRARAAPTRRASCSARRACSTSRRPGSSRSTRAAAPRSSS